MLGAFGEVPLSASSLANQFYNIFQICCMGMGGGAAVLTAQFWGSGNLPALRKTITIMLRFCICIALGFTLVTQLFSARIMSIYTTDPEIIQSGVRYLDYLGWSYLLQGLALTTTVVLRSCRIVRIPLFSTIGAFLLNVFFNWVFIFGNLGAPRMEIAGAALATVIARVFECVFIFGYLIARDTHIAYRLRDLFLNCSDLVRDYFRYSMPVLISDILLAIGNNLVAIVIGRMGSSFVSANAITMVVVQLSTIFNQGVANASSVSIGNTIGAGDREGAYRQGVTYFFLSCIVGVLAGGIILLINPIVIGFYNITPETKAITTQLMRAISLIVVFQCNAMVMTKGVLRAGGDTKFLMLADILFLWIASVPLGMLAGFVFGLSPFWVYFFLKIDNVLKTIWCAHRLKSKKWIKSVDTAPPQDNEAVLEGS
jgi:putative MATE family efflux protein